VLGCRCPSYREWYYGIQWSGSGHQEGLNCLLRLHAEGDSEELPCLHNQEYAKPANPLHRLGKELFAEVGDLVVQFDTTDANFSSEVFGASEDESAEMDHSEDSENGAHVFLIFDYELP
jgi:hypothetical protein